MPKKTRGMHPEDIKAAIRKKGLSLSEFSRQHGLCSAAAGIALYRPYFYVEQKIAAFLGISATKIWPDRYDDNGLPLHRNARSHCYTPYNPNSASLNVAA